MKVQRSTLNSHGGSRVQHAPRLIRLESSPSFYQKCILKAYRNLQNLPPDSQFRRHVLRPLVTYLFERTPKGEEFMKILGKTTLQPPRSPNSGGDNIATNIQLGFRYYLEDIKQRLGEDREDFQRDVEGVKQFVAKAIPAPDYKRQILESLESTNANAQTYRITTPMFQQVDEQGIPLYERLPNSHYRLGNSIVDTMDWVDPSTGNHLWRKLNHQPGVNEFLQEYYGVKELPRPVKLIEAIEHRHKENRIPLSLFERDYLLSELLAYVSFIPEFMMNHRGAGLSMVTLQPALIEVLGGRDLNKLPRSFTNLIEHRIASRPGHSPYDAAAFPIQLHYDLTNFKLNGMSAELLARNHPNYQGARGLLQRGLSLKTVLRNMHRPPIELNRIPYDDFVKIRTMLFSVLGLSDNKIAPGLTKAIPLSYTIAK